MRFIFVSPQNFEKWDWRNLDAGGIGGSETCHIEMTWRLAERGYEVLSYTDIPSDCSRNWRNSNWFTLEEIDYSINGIWLMFRCPSYLDNFKDKKEKEIWFIAQDVDYPDLTDERIKKIDKYVVLSKAHADYTIEKYPALEKKIFLSSNGVRVDLIREIESEEKIERDPKRLIYSSSPDRGLECLLEIFKRAREYDSNLNLHIFYGFNNLDKLADRMTGIKRNKERILKLLDQENVFFHGRVGQKELYKEFLKSGVWCYPTEFSETSCITSMEAQCLGAIPITNPYWALKQNIYFGTIVHGQPYNDALVRARYVGELFRMTQNEHLQKQIRPTMMSQSRMSFSWNRVVNVFESYLLDIPIKDQRNSIYGHDLFVKKNLKGKILNIGCDNDQLQLKEDYGAFNVDVVKTNPFGVENKVDLIADIRDLPDSLKGKFDTVIVAELLEHLPKGDEVKALLQAKQCLRNGGRLIVTCPEETRTVEEQKELDITMGSGLDNYKEENWYTKDCPSHHYRKVKAEEFFNWLSLAELKVEKKQKLDYTWIEGFGVVCY